MKTYTDGEGTYLVCTNKWELRYTSGSCLFEYIVGGLRYQHRLDAFYALELGPASLTQIDAYWRRISNVRLPFKAQMVLYDLYSNT